MGWSFVIGRCGSSECTSLRRAEATEIGSPLVRTTSVRKPNQGVCAWGVYISTRTSWFRPTCLKSRTTPTITRSPSPKPATRFPSGSSPGRNERVKDSFTMMTFCPFSRSCSVKFRPLTKGIPIVRKYSGVTGRKSAVKILPVASLDCPSTVIPKL